MTALVGRRGPDSSVAKTIDYQPGTVWQRAGHRGSRPGVEAKARFVLTDATT